MSCLSCRRTLGHPPRNRMLRIALWPLIALLAFRAAMYVDLTARHVHLRHPYAGMDVPKGPTQTAPPTFWFLPSILMDALDLSTNMRGVGWNWSKSLRFPPDKRPTSRPWFIISVFSLLCSTVSFVV
ncbi:hypothetical protein BKA82DRAFT_3311445 [Pisolithus tinctorius]|nr:hypothetical protein BKA82DRAFT_3311445 [Pisolithus tinctorius]